MIKKWVIINFSIDLPCRPPVGQYQSSQNLCTEVTSYWFYVDFGTHSYVIFFDYPCIEVVAVLTIRDVWVIWSLVLMQLCNCKIPYSALSRKVIQSKYEESHFIGKNLMKYHAVYAKVFKLIISILIFSAKYLYTTHSANKETKLSLTLIQSYHSFLCNTL